jgi:hypothetical protein
VRRAHEVLQSRLAIYLGPHTAKSAVRLCSARMFQRAPDELDTEDVRRMVESFRPMLKTLLGVEHCDKILALLAVELSLRS